MSSRPDLKAASDAIEQHVLAPLMQAARPACHPLVASTLTTIIATLNTDPQHPPALDVLARSISELNRITQSLPIYSLAPSTPPRPFPAPLPPATDTPPRTSQAIDLGSRLAQTLPEQWGDIMPACNKLFRGISQGKSDSWIQNRLSRWLANLLEYKLALVPYFPHLWNLSYYRAYNREMQEGLLLSVCQAVRDLLNRPDQLDGDAQLCYPIARLPLAAHEPEPKQDIFEDELRQRLAQSFQHTYCGDAHHRRLEFVSQTNRRLFHNALEEDCPYYKGTSIVQSSGTSKTRMVHQLGQQTPLLFVCIRPRTTSASDGYPLGNKPFTNLVAELASYKGSDNHRAALLLAAWFNTLADMLQPLAHNAEAMFDKLKQLNNFGSEQHKAARKQFFLEVQAQACMGLADTPIEQNHNVVFRHHLKSPVHRLSCQIRQIHAHLESQQQALVNDAPFFVAINKCVSLGRPLLDSICRAWIWITALKEAKRKQGKSAQASKDTLVCFWLLLVSTNSSASTLVHLQSKQASKRYQNAVPLPTFVGVGFDVLCLEIAPLRSTSNVAQLENFKHYSWPLWTSLLDHNFWATAMTKLLGTYRFHRANFHMVFNVLALRLALQYMSTRGADGVLLGQQATFARAAVERHMRILHRVDRDVVMHICSPSEPVLAITASLIMLEQRRKMPAPGQIASNRYSLILETFKDMCLPLADIDALKGIRGKLLAQMLLMTAWDAAKLIDLPNLTLALCAKHLSKPVALRTILGGLVQLNKAGNRMVEQCIQKVCKAVASRSPAGAKVKVWTHFTHFDLLPVRVEQISPKYLWYCWKRGVAIQMAHPQHSIDGILPVFVGNLLQHFGGNKGKAQASLQMSYVTWEAKNRATTSPLRADKAANKPAHAGPELKHERDGQYADRGALTKHGMLTVLADMGAPEGAARLRAIRATDSFQLWIRGLTGSANYPCLDAIWIRTIMVTLLQAVEAHMSFGRSNQMPDPMDLGSALALPPAEAPERDDAMELKA